MKIKKFMKRNDNAVAGIIVAVMVVGLVLGVISIVQTVYVPKWMESKEAEHMGIIGSQISQLKYAIDTQCLSDQPSTTGIVSSPITLGSKELGFLVSSKAFGHLNLLQNDWKIMFTYGSQTRTFSFGTLKYTSENVYYLDQTYKYEVGCIILEQDQGKIFLIKPSVHAVRTTGPTTGEISFTCYNLQSVGGQTSLSGYGTYSLRTSVNAPSTFSLTKDDDVQSIKIYTSYPTLWGSYFNTTLLGAGFIKLGPDHPSDWEYDVVVINDASEQSVLLTFNNNIIDIIPHLYTKNISVELGPGMIG